MTDAYHYERTVLPALEVANLAKKMLDDHGPEGVWQVFLRQMMQSKDFPTSSSFIGKLITCISREVVFRGMRESDDPFLLDSTLKADVVLAHFRKAAYIFHDFGISDRVLSEELSTTVASKWQTNCHELAGRRVYEVSPGLSDRLLATELRGLSTDDLRLPFRNIFVSTPSRDEVQIYNDQTEWHRVEGFYVTEDKTAAGRLWRFMFVGSSKNPDKPDDDALVHFGVALPGGISLEEALRRERERHGALITTREKSPGFNAFFLSNWERLFKYAMNIIVYATTPDINLEHVDLNKEFRQIRDRVQKLPKNSQKREDLKKKLREMDPRHRILLGRGIPPWTNEERGLDREGRTVTVRVQVQGHWKNQPYGPKSSLRKRLFVSPYWRGPELGDVSTPIHVLK
jgi:hypothetical protein